MFDASAPFSGADSQSGIRLFGRLFADTTLKTTVEVIVHANEMFVHGCYGTDSASDVFARC